jgi:hypothetical protein
MIQVPTNTTSFGPEITTPEFPADIKKKAKHTRRALLTTVGRLCSSSKSARLCPSVATRPRI